METSTALISLGTALSVALISHRFAVQRDRRNRRLQACDAFRAAVLSELSSVYPLATEWPEDVDTFLRSRFPQLQTAVTNFRPFVPVYRRCAFDRAWQRYRCATGREIDAQCYHHYMAFGDNPKYQQAFRANVAKLLSFAGKA
ncbi:hypothetical protein [Trinickia sp.]|uniref:hypothetical protein n=1 Tax=Trinickia sp. TaxID=2571163 RepID=UPI003F7E8F83